jgi:hypothetical protein
MQSAAASVLNGGGEAGLAASMAGQPTHKSVAATTSSRFDPALPFLTFRYQWAPRHERETQIERAVRVTAENQ